MPVPGLVAPSIRVPGLLDDNALQEQLKVYTEQANSTTSMTPPSSAVDFATKINQDFISQPSRAAVNNQPKAKPPQEAQTAQATAQSGIDPIMSGLMQGAVKGYSAFNAWGALSPEDAEAERAERIASEQEAQSALKSQVETRRQLRGMSPEDAEKLGLPVAPGMDTATIDALKKQADNQETKMLLDAQDSVDKEVAGPAPTTEWWKNAYVEAQKAGANAMIFDPIAGSAAIVDLQFGGDGDNAVREWAENGTKALEAIMPGDKARANDFMTQLSQGGGTMAGYMGAGFIMSTVGLPATGTVATLGALAGGVNQVRDAERFNASNMQKLVSWYLGAGLGAAEALPLDRAFFNIEKSTGGLVTRMMSNTSAGTLTEFTQELGQALGQDVIAFTVYDENREFDVTSYLRAGAMGGILGAGMGMSGAALNEAGINNGKAQTPGEAVQTADEAEREAILDQFISVRLDQAEAAATQLDTVAAGVPSPAPAGTATSVPPDVAAVADNIITGFAQQRRPPTQIAEEFAAALPRPPVYNYEEVQGRGGTVPAPGPDGTVVLRHYSKEQREILDPAARGTGPLIGEERRRLLGPDAVDRTYFGVNTDTGFVEPGITREEYAQLSAEEKAAAKRLAATTFADEDRIADAVAARFDTEARRRAGYRRENDELGDFVHEVAVDPNDLYNWYEDPMGLRAQLGDKLVGGELVTKYEKLIKDAGFKGVYFSESELGQTAMLFEASQPRDVKNARYGMSVSEIATPQDFQNLSHDSFAKGGWAVVTGTQEARGDASTPENVMANQALEQELQQMGVKYTPVAGSYKGTPQGQSYLVFMPEKEALELGRKYGQESILTRKGLEYADGRVTPVDPQGTLIGDAARAADFYSETPDGQAFSLGLDFDATTQADLDSDEFLARSAPSIERIEKLMTEVPGLAGILPYLTPEEADIRTARSAQAIVDVFSKLPSAEETAAVAMSGNAKRGWYANSAKALLDIFGVEDAPRFAALLAALSPQTSVETNATNALKVWTAWVQAGRPTETAAIRRIMGANVLGGGTKDSVLPAWVNNTLRALTAVDPTTIRLSGPKVNAFAANLRGAVNEVTNDTWMANYALMEQTVLSGRADADGIKGAGPGYKAFSAAMRAAAEAATRLSGDTWTPAEIQETVWSWAKTLYETANNTTTAEELLKLGFITDADIASTPDFATLFADGVYRQILEQGGYDVRSIGESLTRDAGGATGRSVYEVPEGAAIDRGAYERHLLNAARRLDELRRQRAEAEGVVLEAPADPVEVFGQDDVPFFAQTAANRGSYKAEPQRPAAGVDGATQADAGDVRLTRIGETFIKLLNLTVRQGRFTLRGGDIMGQFSRRFGTVRMKSWGDLSTLVHEGGHALQAQSTGALSTFIKKNAKALVKVGEDLYGGDLTNAKPDAQIAEGFAEFFRVYVMNRAYAEQHYKKLTEQFDTVLDQNAPELREGLKSVGDSFAAWLQLPSTQVVANMIVSGEQTSGINAVLEDLREQGIGTWFNTVVTSAMATTVNRYANLNVLVSEMLNLGQTNQNTAIDLKRAEDPRVLIRLAVNNGNRAMVQTVDGVMGYRSTHAISRGLREAMLRYHGMGPNEQLKNIDPQRQKDFAAYLVALRGLDEYRRMQEGRIKRPPVNASLGDLKKAAAELYGKYGDDFAQAAEIVHEYGMALWQKSYDAGLMTKETYEEGLTRKFYAPLQRDMSDRDISTGDMSARGVGQGQKLVRRFRGSDRDIIDPMDALMTKTFQLERVIAENEVKKALAQLADRVGLAGALVERIPAHQLIGTQYSIEEVARAVTKDENLTDADAQDIMNTLETSIEEGNRIALFRSQQASAKGENILFFWEDGKLAAIQLKDGSIGSDVVNTLNGVGSENLHLLVDLVAQTSTVFRAAVTAWPDFLLVNFIRDQMSAWVLNDVGYVPFATGIRGMADEIRQADWARHYNAAMGIMGGMNTSALHKARVDRDITALKAKGYFARVMGHGEGLAGGIKAFARVTELSETGTRLGLFRSAYERAKADGLTEWEASIEASYLATDYIDFGLSGNRMMMFRRTIPFLNAQLQGLYKMMRTLGADEVQQRKGLTFALGAFFKDINKLDLSRAERKAVQTGRKAWLKMASLGLLSALLHFTFEDDPDYQDASEYLRTTGWVIPLGEGRIWYIPKPFELAIVANFVERGLEYASGDKEAKNRFLRGAAMNLLPPTSPPAIQTLVEQIANEDFFAGRDIVPDHMLALAPELQYNHSTSEIAKQIGSAMGWSPMRVDHALSGLGASAYRDLVSMTNSFDPNRASSDVTDWPITRRFVRDARRGATSSQDFWSFASTTDGKLRRAETTYKTLHEGGREQSANEFLATLEPDERAYALLNTHFKADAKRLNPHYRVRQLNTIVSAMRREMVSDLGLADTEGTEDGSIPLSATQKYRVDEALSEYARREMRNTLIMSKAPGWANKQPLPTEPTIELLRATDPRVAEEFERRVAKAKVYSAETVQEYWPEARDRVLSDRDSAYLDDLVTIAKVMR